MGDEENGSVDSVPIKSYIKDILDIQERSFRSMVQIFVKYFKSDINEIRKEVKDLKESLEYSQKEIDDNKAKIASLESKLEVMDEGINFAHAGLENLDTRNDYLENMSRRNNIKVFGIEEAANESWDDCETKVNKAISEKLGM